MIINCLNKKKLDGKKLSKKKFVNYYLLKMKQ